MHISFDIPDEYGGILYYLATLERKSVKDYVSGLCIERCKKTDKKKKVTFTPDEFARLSAAALRQGLDISAAAQAARLAAPSDTPATRPAAPSDTPATRPAAPSDSPAAPADDECEAGINFLLSLATQ